MSGGRAAKPAARARPAGPARTAGAAAALFVLIVIPRAAHACASCLWSAYGDRTFNWAFLGLIVMPFGVGAAIGAVLLVAHRRRTRRALNPLFKETT